MDWKFWRRPARVLNPIDAEDRRIVASMVVKTFGAFLDDERAINFCTIRMNGETWGDFEVTIRRADAATPAELLLAKDFLLNQHREALRKLTFAARTTGGGPDADLMVACDAAERLLAPST